MIAPLLTEFDQVVTECRDLLETEIAGYRAGAGGSDVAVLQHKECLIDKLGSLLERLKETRAGCHGPPMIDRAQLNLLQQKFMRLLRLDRELERHLLSPRTASRASATATPRPSGLAARLYQTNEHIARTKL